MSEWGNFINFVPQLIKKKGGNKMTKKIKRAGQNSHMSAKKPDSLQSCLKTQMLKLHSLPTTQLRNA
jgi:hypothetical protein